MTDDDILAIATTLIFDHTHLAGESRADGIANVDLEVDTFVLPTPTTTKIGSHHTTGSGHVKMAEVYSERIGKFCSLVCVSIIPVIIKFSRRRLDVFAVDEVLQCKCIHSFHLPVYGSLTRKQVLGSYRLGRHEKKSSKCY